MSRPRLLQIFNRTLGGGGMDLAIELVRQSLAAECDVRECIFQSADWTGPDAPSVARQALYLLYNRTALQKVLSTHCKMQADAWIVHNWEPVVSAGIYRAAREAGVPIIQFVHNFRPYSVSSYLWVGQNLAIGDWRRNFLREVAVGSWQQSRLKSAWLALILASLHWRGDFRAVKAWVAVSEFMREQFIEAGVPAADVFALRHPWTPLAQPRANADDDYYLFLGRLTEEKGVRVLVEAWDLVARQSVGRAPRLVMGGDGPLAGWVAAVAERNPLLQYCGVVGGKVKEALLTGCRALIAPSVWREPLGLVVYEAFEHSRPVLAARSGGLAELVQPGTTGLLHTPGSTTELAAHVLELDRAPDRRQKLGQAGREWLLANTREDEWLRRFLEIVSHAVRRAKSTVPRTN